MDLLSGQERVSEIFDIGAEDLRSVLRRASGWSDVGVESIADTQPFACGNGRNGDYLAPVFMCESPAGERRALNLFVKRAHDPLTPEPMHYEHLEAHGAPIPRFYGAHVDPKGKQIFFLEFVEAHEHVPYEELVTRDRSSLEDYVRLAARFNAIEPSEEYQSNLEYSRVYPRTDLCDFRRDLAGSLHTISLLWGLAGRGCLGGRAQAFCSRHSGDLDRLQELERATAQQVARMPTALVHDDLGTDNMATRPMTNEYVVTDLEHVKLAPRFSDLVGCAEAIHEAAASVMSMQELADLYVSAYTQAGGATIPSDELSHEIGILVTAKRIDTVRQFLSDACCIARWNWLAPQHIERRGRQFLPETDQDEVIQAVEALLETAM